MFPFVQHTIILISAYAFNFDMSLTFIVFDKQLKFLLHNLGTSMPKVWTIYKGHVKYDIMLQNLIALLQKKS